MRFARFGVTLESLAPAHLELVRQWRNSDWVRPHMRYRSVVGPQDQVQWFKTLDPRNNWYFVAQIEEVPFALFHVKNIDWVEGSGESGGFVGDAGFIGRPEPAQATLALMDFAFLVLELRGLKAHYRPELERIARFNAQLGYQILKEETDGFVCAHVTSDRYFTNAAAFRKAAIARHGASAVLNEPDTWLAERVERLQTSLLPDFELRLR
jgi:UDP-4-amino-4,6-dideoxy-N-acetyl-beta-L-altrosamine N-acetyltransferase